MESIGPSGSLQLPRESARRAVALSIAVHLVIILALITISTGIRLSSSFTHPGAAISKQPATAYHPTPASPARRTPSSDCLAPSAAWPLIVAKQSIDRLIAPGREGEGARPSPTCR